MVSRFSISQNKVFSFLLLLVLGLIFTTQAKGEEMTPAIVYNNVG